MACRLNSHIYATAICMHMPMSGPLLQTLSDSLPADTFDTYTPSNYVPVTGMTSTACAVNSSALPVHA